MKENTMLENLTKEKQIEIAVRLYDNNTYGTTYGKGLYRNAIYNGVVDARSPIAKYLVDLFNYEDWCNRARTNEQMTVLAQIHYDKDKLYSWIQHYEAMSKNKRLVGGYMSLDINSLGMEILICDEQADFAGAWKIAAKPCKAAKLNTSSPQILGTNADLDNW